MKIRVGRKNWYPLRTINAIFQVASALLLSWSLLSYLEIVIKNTTEGPIYSAWNFWLRVVK